ncbi:MAG: hypothetical protein JNG89_16665 [Planctomycetaceae bacterium]|nr:hypothetical protein [Planctomycetaceae bacterium]
MQPFIESDVTELEIAPDGRVFIFGASRQVMSILAELGSRDAQRRTATAGRNDEIQLVTCGGQADVNHE